MGKKFEAAKAKVEDRPYTLEEALPLVKAMKFAKFDETVEVAIRLGVDPKHADQMVRGTVVLPHGLGRSKRVLVIAGAEKQKDAQEAGADVTGGDEVVEKILGGWMDFDAVVATPDMMRGVGPSRQGARAARPDAEPEDRDGHHRHQRRRCAKSRPARSSSASTRRASCTRRSARRRLPRRGAHRERARARRQHRQGEAAGGQGPVPEEHHRVVHHGPRGPHRYHHGRGREALGPRSSDGCHESREGIAAGVTRGRVRRARRPPSWWTTAG